MEDYSAFWNEAVKYSTAFTLSGNIQTFSGLAATDIDLDSDGKVDNKHDIKAYAGTLTALIRGGLGSSAAVSLTYSSRRPESVEGTEMTGYLSVSGTVVRRLLILDPEYETSKAYRSELYVPSLSGGVSVDWMRCTKEAEACENRIDQQFILTPFIDVRIANGAQFRIGLPVRRDKIGDEAGTRLEPLLQLGFGLTSL